MNAEFFRLERSATPELRGLESRGWIVTRGADDEVHVSRGGEALRIVLSDQAAPMAVGKDSIIVYQDDFYGFWVVLRDNEGHELQVSGLQGRVLSFCVEDM